MLLVLALAVLVSAGVSAACAWGGRGEPVDEVAGGEGLPPDPDSSQDAGSGPGSDGPDEDDPDGGDEPGLLELVEITLAEGRDFPGGGGMAGESITVTAGAELQLRRDGHVLNFLFEGVVAEEDFLSHLQVERDLPFSINVVSWDEGTRTVAQVRFDERQPPGTRRTVRLEAGLRSASGHVLQEPLEFFLEWVDEPRVESLRVEGFPHLNWDLALDLTPETLAYSLPPGRHGLEVVFSLPMNRRSVEETVAAGLGGGGEAADWIWENDRRARFVLDLQDRARVTFDGALGLGGVTVWEGEGLHLRAHAPEAVVAFEPRTGDREVLARIPLRASPYVLPAPGEGRIFFTESLGSLGDPCALAPFLMEVAGEAGGISGGEAGGETGGENGRGGSGDEGGVPAALGPFYAGWGRGALPPFWDPEGLRVHYAGQVFDTRTGVHTPAVPSDLTASWAGWAPDFANERLALLWMDYESGVMDLLLSAGGEVTQRFEAVGPGRREAGFVFPQVMHWLPGGRVLIFDVVMEGVDTLITLDTETGERSVVAAEYYGPVPSPAGDALVAARMRATEVVRMDLVGTESWRIRVDAWLRGASWSPAGDLIALNLWDDRVLVVDAGDGSVVWEGEGIAVGWRADGRLLLYTGRLQYDC